MINAFPINNEYVRKFYNKIQQMIEDDNNLNFVMN